MGFLSFISYRAACYTTGTLISITGGLLLPTVPFIGLPLMGLGIYIKLRAWGPVGPDDVFAMA